MATFEVSPRASKRRKIVADDSTSSIHSRIQRKAKQASYGKSASPKTDDGAVDRVAKTPITGTNGRNESQSGKFKKTKRTAQRSESETKSTQTVVDRDLEDLLEASSKPALERQIQGDESSRSISRGGQENAEALQTSSRKRRKKSKGWVYVEDTDEHTHNARGDTVHGEPEIGRLKRGHNDLTIDIKPQQLQFRRSRGIIEDNIGRDDGSASRRAHRVPKRTEGIEDDTNNAQTLAGPAAKLQRSQRRTRLRTSPTPSVEESVEQDTEKGSVKDASPDELANGSQDENSEQEPLVQTPTSKPKKRAPIAKHSLTPSRIPIANDTHPSIPEEESRLDLQSLENDNAQNLLSLLKRYPDESEKLKAHVLSGLTSKRRLPLTNLEDEHRKVQQLVEQTVLAGEGNSMLVIGSRGSGKTLLVETVLAELSFDHRDEFHVVRLNGFIHTDDKLALREIWRQLGREMAVEDDDLGGRSNYADTLTSLLALLAHPNTEDTGEDQAATARSVVFILDEFDLFASHPRQTLLYNLFDVAQSRNAPIAVLGLTTKVNVVDNLEKRVKSRFSQRYVHLSLPKSFTVFQDICLSSLKCNPTTQELLHDKKNIFQQLSTAWNAYATSLLSSTPLQHFLLHLYTTTKSIPAFHSASLLPLSSLSPTHLPTPSSFISTPLTLPDNKLHLIPTLSTLSLSLLIAAARLDIILATSVCTLGMAYDEYVALASRSKLQSSAAGQMAIGGAGGGARVWSKQLARGAWEELERLELVVPAVGGGRGGAGRGEMWRVDVGLEEIGGVLEREGGRGGALGKWCREI